MAINYYYISKSGYSGTTPVIDYTFNFYLNDNFSPIYTYTRRSVSYGGGVYLPALSTFIEEADKLKNSSGLDCGVRNNYNDILNLTILNNRLSNLSSVTPKDGSFLGFYLGSNPVISGIGAVSLFGYPGLNYQKHNYQNGYIEEKFLNDELYLFVIDGEFKTGAITDGSHVSIVNCVFLTINFTITSSKIPTTCCVLSCCEPDKYILIT